MVGVADQGLASNRVVAAIRRRVNRAGFDITREPFDDRFVRALTKRGIDCVLDVGANTGQYGTDLRAARFTGRILSVEPLSSAFAELTQATERDPSWTAVRAAASDQAGTLLLHIAGNSVSSSPLPMLAEHVSAAPDSAYVGTEEVPAMTVDEIVAQHGIEPNRTLLKIDVQGFENSVLDGAADTLKLFNAVQLELSLVPLYDGGRLMPEMIARMDAHGFDLWLIEPAFFEPATGRMLQCDGTFFRR